LPGDAAALLWMKGEGGSRFRSCRCRPRTAAAGVHPPGLELRSSVRESAGWWWRPAAEGRVWLVSWENAEPLVTVLSAAIRSIVARMWPQRGPGLRAWKARPGSPSTPDTTPMAQVRSVWDRPLLTVADRQMPMLRARRGHGRRGPTWLGPGASAPARPQGEARPRQPLASLASAPQEARQLLRRYSSPPADPRHTGRSLIAINVRNSHVDP
jgi:hypothetical protein